MKITCQDCGHNNELGRIFCGSCGKKLDMSQMSQENVERERRRPRIGGRIKGVVLILLIAAIGAAALALWPLGPLAEDAVLSDPGPVRGQLSGVWHAVEAGSPMRIVLREQEINSYLDVYRSRANLQSLQADIQPGIMVVRMIDQWGPWDIGGYYSLGPLQYTCEVRVVPHGKGYKLDGAALGRLPLPDRLAGPVYTRMADVFKDSAGEQEILKKLDKLVFKADRLEASFKP